MPAPEDLVAHVREARVIIVGAGVAGLVAAWECARVGLTVALLDAADHIGGSLAPVEVDGLWVDGAHIGFTPGDPDADAVLPLLGCERTEEIPGGRMALAGMGAAPTGGLLGIPANPWAPDVRRIIGWSGTWRAYLDRLRPPMTIGREPSLGALVRGRLGARVAERVVAPIVAARWEIDADDLDADAVLPGVSTALTRTGSLTGAVTQLQAEPAPARRALTAGFGELLTALHTHLQDLGAVVLTSHEVTEISRAGSGWRVHVDDDVFDADAVIVATGPAEARRLLTPVLNEEDALGQVPEVDVVTLVVDATAGTGPDIVAFPAGSAARSATDLTGTSPRGGAAAGGRRIIRVVLTGEEREEIEAVDQASAAATALLGRPVTPDQLRGHSRSRRVAAGTGRRVGDDARIEAARAALAAHEGLHAVGGWLAGGDVAAEIGDAVRTADRVRHGLLWGPGPAISTP